MMHSDCFMQSLHLWQHDHSSFYILFWGLTFIQFFCLCCVCRVLQTEDDLRTGMYKVLEHLRDHEDAWPFHDPVEEEYAPNYYAVIRRPMHISRVSTVELQGCFSEPFAVSFSEITCYGSQGIRAKSFHELKPWITLLL